MYDAQQFSAGSSGCICPLDAIFVILAVHQNILKSQLPNECRVKVCFNLSWHGFRLDLVHTLGAQDLDSFVSL